MRGSAADVCPGTTDQPKEQKIPGGTCAIHPLQCCIIWAVKQEKVISPLAFKVYFAAHEVKYWRSQVHPGQPCADTVYRFERSDIRRLLPDVPEAKIARAFVELEAIHLLTVSDTGIRFAQNLHDLTVSERIKQRAAVMSEQLHEHTRDKIIKVPRRLIKLIVQCGRRVVRAATLIGMLLTTMLTKRTDEYQRYQGCCKATWIARLFGVNAKRVNLERARLIAEGWFHRLPTPQRVRQRYGEWVALNLNPSAPQTPGEGDTSGSSQVQPPTAQKPSQLQPPLKKPVTPSDIEHNQILNPQTPSGAYQPSPTWTNIQPDDLRLDNRSESLYQEAMQRGYLKPTPADRINFYAAIAHALRVARHNACGLLRTIVEKGLWYVISQADEYNAIQRLRHAKEVTQTQPAQPVLSRLFQTTSKAGTEQAGLQPIVRSKDALVVKTLTEDLKQAGVSGDLFNIIKRYGHLQDWDRSRWERAEREVMRARLSRARERYAAPFMTRMQAVVQRLGPG